MLLTPGNGEPMSSFRIILAEDEFDMRDMLMTILGNTGAVVHEAASGWEVLELLARHEDTRLVISDIRMPAPDGLQALAMVRAAGLQTPFLFITSFDGDTERAMARRLDADLLAKPFTAPQLLERIAQLITFDAGRGIHI